MGGSLVYAGLSVQNLHPQPNYLYPPLKKSSIQGISSKAIGAQQQLDVLVRKAIITEVDVLQVSQTTVGQQDNPAWHLAR